jgi:hypothetical protein
MRVEHTTLAMPVVSLARGDEHYAIARAAVLVAEPRNGRRPAAQHVGGNRSRHARLLRGGREVADLTWEASKELDGEHNREFDAALRAYHAGCTQPAEPSGAKSSGHASVARCRETRVTASARARRDRGR